ncbi:jupiter microtubule associated homolog 2 [Aplochiton taeniatus]
MTSTNIFQGLEGAKPSSRVLRPPGGTSSNLFGGYEEEPAAARRPNKMASTVFVTAEESQKEPRRSNPPGGRTSGIFGEPECPVQSPRPSPGVPTNNIFGREESACSPPIHSSPPKQKDKISVGSTGELESQVSQATPTGAKEECLVPISTSAKVLPAVPSANPEPELSSPGMALKDHEPHLGPRPRSHNKVLNPPGGKSSVVFY